MHVCPLAGKLLPELIVGEPGQAFEDICFEQEADLHILPAVGLHPVTDAEWSTLISDFRKGSQS